MSYITDVLLLFFTVTEYTWHTVFSFLSVHDCAAFHAVFTALEVLFQPLAPLVRVSTVLSIGTKLPLALLSFFTVSVGAAPPPAVPLTVDVSVAVAL